MTSVVLFTKLYLLHTDVGGVEKNRGQDSEFIIQISKLWPQSSEFGCSHFQVHAWLIKIMQWQSSYSWRTLIKVIVTTHLCVRILTLRNRYKIYFQSCPQRPHANLTFFIFEVTRWNMKGAQAGWLSKKNGFNAVYKEAKTILCHCWATPAGSLKSSII